MPRTLPKNILVVDDDRIRNLKIATLIKRFGYNVFVATNSPDFMRMVNGILPHLVLLNIHMPRIGDKTCLEWLRSNKGLDMIHVIVMGEKKEGKMLEKSLEKGANAKIIRPITPTVLFRVI
jgi:PleD family two-component response regulator